MKRLIPSILVCAATLCGCASFTDRPQQRAEETVGIKVAAPMADADFCRRIAQHDSGMVYDAQSKSRVYAHFYHQCLVTYAVNDEGLRVAGLGGGASSY